MKFLVESGDYSVAIDRPSFEQAVHDAILLWDCKAVKPKLSQVITAKSLDNGRVVNFYCDNIVANVRGVPLPKKEK